MDEYSFISENGNVRQIRDLIAKGIDEQQDVRLDKLEEIFGSIQFVPSQATTVIQVTTNNPTNWTLTATKNGYIPIAYSIRSELSYNQIIMPRDINVTGSTITVSGQTVGIFLADNAVTIFLDVTWIKDFS